MTTARDIIKSALKKIAVLGTGSSLSNEDATDGLTELNAMIAQFSVEGSMIYNTAEETFPLTANQQTYTIGSGGDFNTDIPVDIKSMTYTIGSIDYALTPYNEYQWSNISLKSTAGIPYVYWFKDNYPLASINLYYVPSSSGTLTIYSDKRLTGFTDLDTVYAMPPQYESMLVYNLAVRLAPEYEREASMTVQRTAKRAYDTVSNQNRRNKIQISRLDIPSSENNRYGISSIYGDYR